MNDLQIFRSAEFGSIRTVEQDGKVLFCGTDVAAALGYSNPRDAIARHCRYVVKRDIPHPQSADRKISMTFVPEGDVYRLITHSRLPAAEQFEHWVFDEVLPTIRCTGSYSMPAHHAQQIADLQTLQEDLKKWRELEEQFAELASDARRRYESNRDTRDKCRAEVVKLERLIDVCIASLAIEVSGL